MAAYSTSVGACQTPRSLSKEPTRGSPLPSSWSPRFQRCAHCFPQRRKGFSCRSEHPDENDTVLETRQPPPSQGAVNPSGLAETVVWGGQLPSGRRLVLSGISASGIVLLGNLGGLTSFLLSLDGGKFAAASRFDVLFPVNGYKRAADFQNGYEFLYPSDWLADQTVFSRSAQRIEQANALDPPPLKGQAKGRVVEPLTAYGPPGSSGEHNVSVIVAPILPSFQLQSLGPPLAAAQRFLDTSVAPPGSGFEAQLVTALDRYADGELYYQWEFIVKSPAGWVRHNVSVCAARRGLLYSFNAQCPQSSWWEEGQRLLTAAASFRLINAGAVDNLS